MDLLFASLARAAGFEVNIVLSGDRSENFFNPDKYNSPAFIHPACIAVKVGGDYKYFNPGTPYLPYGKLVWNEENVAAMIIGEGGFIWKKTPLSPPVESPANRTGKFKLLEDGTLEGIVRLEYDVAAISRRREGFTGRPPNGRKSKDEIENISARRKYQIFIEIFPIPPSL